MIVAGAALCTACASPVGHAPSTPSQPARWDDCPGVRYPFDIPTDTPDCIARSGPLASGQVKFSMGDTVTQFESASTVKARGRFTKSVITDEPLNIIWSTGGQTFAFENVGGMGSVLLLNFFGSNDTLEAVNFSWQNRPLKLDEVIVKARRLQSWLTSVGYQPWQLDGKPRPMFWITGSKEPPTIEDWADATALLADEEANVADIGLYSLALGDIEVHVSAVNERRSTLNDVRRFAEPDANTSKPHRTRYDGAGGYEWHLNLFISKRVR